MPGVAVAVGVGVALIVGVGVAVGVGVSVADEVGVGDAVGVGVAFDLLVWPPNRPVERLGWPTECPKRASSDAVTTPAPMMNASRPVISASLSGRRLARGRSCS